MGTYSILLIDSPLTDEQQSMLRQRADEVSDLKSNWDRLSRYKADELNSPLTAADKTFWILETGTNHGHAQWRYLRRHFIDPIRVMVPAAAVYLTDDYLLFEHEWTREQWLDIAEGRQPKIHPSYVELLTDAALKERDSAAENSRIKTAARYLTHRVGTPLTLAKNSGGEWEAVIREVLKALDDAG